MSSKEYLEKVTLGKIQYLPGKKLHLSEYDSAWPKVFEKEATKIRAVLPDDYQLEHAGSTSVPGLVAKPIIDMILLVADSRDEANYTPYLELLGYTLRIREPRWFEHRMFKKEVPAVNLHVFSQGCPEAERMLRFRDYLRSYPEAKKRYGDAKRELVKHDWDYIQQYADAKTDVIKEILAEADR